MKITIDKGETIDSALENLKSFLKENYSDYPIIKNPLNIYVTLKNGDGQMCPDNEKEFALNQNKTIDRTKEKKAMAFNITLNEWNWYVRLQGSLLESTKHNIELGNAYVNTAKEKNRKTENVEKRKKEIENLKGELVEREHKLWVAQLLNKAVEDGMYRKVYYKHGFSYKYELTCVFVFENVNGFTGYFYGEKLYKGVLE